MKMRSLNELFRRYVPFCFVCIAIVFACMTDNRHSRSNKAYSVQIPKSKSALDGWQSCKIKKCGPKCCELVFPMEFGLKNKSQLMTLRELVNTDLEHDVDCMFLVNQDALNQIKFLATERQDADAALMLLNPQSHGGFNLDGELAEEFTGEYQLGVLEKFKDLHSILNKNIEEDLSASICSWVEISAETTGRRRVKNLLKYLKSKNLSEFAVMISEKCGQGL